MTRIVGSAGLVFLCGIAGVGKTYLVEGIRVRMSRLVVARASAIISDARQMMGNDELRALPDDELAKSQELLLHGMAALRTTHPEDLVILDGHSVIDTDSGFYEVGVDVIARLRVQLLVHIEDEVSRILLRRQGDGSRRRPVRSENALAEYQRRSLAQCELYRTQLNIPLARISAGDEEELLRVLTSL